MLRIPLAFPGQRIGVMGGSFNPPHKGHLVVAEAALKRLRLDQLWWVVTPGNPLKSSSELSSLEDRIQRSLLLARHPRMRVTGFESMLGSAYTAETLSYLTKRYPSLNFVWVMGADNLASFDRWQQWRSIANMMPIAVVDRPGWRLKALASPAAHALQNSASPKAKRRHCRCSSRHLGHF
jgi:nicotinate-nucleotide adenylyltransferase